MATEQNIDIFAQLQVLTWELDVNRLVLTINNQQKSETHELLAWQQTIHRLDRDQVINMLLDTISERRSMFDCQLKLQSADAQWKTFRMRGVPVRSQGAAKVSFVKGILEDFSQYDLQLMELQKKVSRQDMLAKEKNLERQ